MPALTDYGKSKTFTFGDVATEIARIHLLFHECQVRRGDKIALIGKDSSRWCIAYYGGCYLWGDYRAYSSGL